MKLKKINVRYSDYDWMKEDAIEDLRARLLEVAGMSVGGYAQAYGIDGYAWGTLRNAEIAKKIVDRALERGTYQHEVIEGVITSSPAHWLRETPMKYAGRGEEPEEDYKIREGLFRALTVRKEDA
jgi:hypothetical protein